MAGAALSAPVRQAVILVGTGLAWFAGTLVPGMVFLHRGPLLHLAAAQPNGRVRGRAVLAVVAAGYVVAAIAPLSRLDVVSGMAENAGSRCHAGERKEASAIH